MTGWDISSSGVAFVTGLVADAIDALGEDIKSYGKHMESAAVSAGTLSTPDGGGAPVGPVGAALALFTEKTAQDVLFLGARAVKSVKGARNATHCYEIGALDMAANAQEAALKAPPKVDLPGTGKQDGAQK